MYILIGLLLIAISALLISKDTKRARAYLVEYKQPLHWDFME